MTYATIMVSLALDQPNEARLEAAGQLAERFDAGIVGIAAAQFSPPVYFTSGEQAQNRRGQREAQRRQPARAGPVEGVLGQRHGGPPERAGNNERGDRETFHVVNRADGARE